jgi:hypothetical protein
LPRTASIKARDFTNVIYVDRMSYMEACELQDNDAAMGVYYRIQNALLNNDYTIINMSCYICRMKDHIAVNCEQFKLFRGNLHTIYQKMSKS